MNVIRTFRPLAMALMIAVLLAIVAPLTACKPEVGGFDGGCKDKGATRADSDGTRYECTDNPRGQTNPAWKRVA